METNLIICLDRNSIDKCDREKDNKKNKKMSTEIKITRENGGIRYVAANNDGVSGMLVYIATIPTGFSSENIQEIRSLSDAETLGITSTSTDNHIKALHYHLSEAYRLNNSLRLYLGIYSSGEDDEDTSEYDFAEISSLRRKANGEIRQVVVWAGEKEYNKTDVRKLQEEATKAENEEMPLSIIYCPKVSDVTQMESGVQSGNRNVSVCVGEDLENGISGVNVTMAGVVLGILSKSKVNESIAWVKKFDTGIYKAGLVDGRAYNELSQTEIASMEEKRLLFVKTYAGYSGVYMNDSYTMDESKSDYNTIERMRTMDKAVRGVREYMLPMVGAPVEIDAQSGKIDAAVVEMWKNEANRYLEQMDRDEEISGYEVEIDSEQNVLSTSKIEIVIRQVPMGIARKIAIKMSYAEEL